MRALRRTGSEEIIVELPDRVRIAVPAWMLDPMLCAQLPQESRPRVALRALLELAGLIGLHRLPCAGNVSKSGPSSQPGKDD